MPRAELQFVRPDFTKYTAVAEVARAIYREYDPHMHSASLDEVSRQRRRWPHHPNQPAPHFSSHGAPDHPNQAVPHHPSTLSHTPPQPHESNLTPPSTPDPTPSHPAHPPCPIPLPPEEAEVSERSIPKA